MKTIKAAAAMSEIHFNAEAQVMSKIYVVMGEHPEVAGCSVSMHASLAGANVQAAELTNMIAQYADGIAKATPQSWPDVLEACQEHFGAQYCYVEVTEKEVQS